MSEITLNIVADEMLSELSGINRASLNTINAYKRDIYEFIEFCSEKSIITLNQVTDKTIRHFVMMLSSEKLEKSSISRKLSSLRKLFEYSIKNNYIQNNPISKIPNPKTIRKLPETFNQDVFPNIFFKIDNTNSTENERIRIKTIFELLYGCALRVSELCSLNFGSLDLNNSNLIVSGKGAKIRIVPIGAKSIQIIKKYIETQKEINSQRALFINANGERISRFEVYKLVKKYLGLVTDIHKKCPHILRHSAATHMLDNEADIMAVKEILGHENLSTTQIYTHVSIERLKRSYKKAHPKS